MEITRELLDEFEGNIPGDMESLLSSCLLLECLYACNLVDFENYGEALELFNELDINTNGTIRRVDDHE